MNVFDVCLRLNTEPSGDFKVVDFGFTDDELQFIYPFGNNIYIYIYILLLLLYIYLNVFGVCLKLNTEPSGDLVRLILGFL